MIPHLKVHPAVRPAIVLIGLIAGFAASDLWLLCAALLACWFIDAQPWEPYKVGGVVRRKSNGAPD